MSFDIVEKKGKPSARQIAKEFIEQRTKGIVYHNGRTYEYTGKKYEEVTDLTVRIRRFLIAKGYPHSNTAVSNCVGDVQAIAYGAAQFHKSLPFYAGTGDFPKNIIAYQNGLLDVDAYLSGNLTLIPHTNEWVSTLCLPYDFDPSATCDLWINFLNEIFDHDQEKITLLQEWCGYCLLPDTSQHKLLVKIGPPRAGKGTTDRIQQALLGTENTTGYNLHLLASNFGLSQLMGKHVAYIGEVNLAQSRDKYRILETLNSIVGSDPVCIDEKYGKPVSVRLPTRFNLSCNEMPSFVDPSGALSTRMLILDFQKSFVGREDRELESKLLTQISGICNWAMDGLRRIRISKRFAETASSTPIMESFRRDSSIAYAFMQDCLVVESRLNSGYFQDIELVDTPTWVTSQNLRAAYDAWSETNDHAPVEFGFVAKNLRALVPRLRTGRQNINGSKVSVYQGIGLKGKC